MRRRRRVQASRAPGGWGGRPRSHPAQKVGERVCFSPSLSAGRTLLLQEQPKLGRFGFAERYQIPAPPKAKG